MTRIIHGKVHGKTIELDEDLGLAAGQEVEVQITPVPATKVWGEGIRRSAGGWADYPELDAVLEQLYQERKRERRAQGLP